MEHCSQAGGPLSATAQRILAALRAQHADRVAQRRETGETGGAVLRCTLEEGSWSRTQQSSTTGDQRGAGGLCSRGHPGDQLYVEGMAIRDGLSLPLHGRLPELSCSNGNGGGDPTGSFHCSSQGPPEHEDGIRGPDQAEILHDGAVPERESGGQGAAASF
ncbi:hypothetical protein SKAU_G00030070 [Synaphobranchus kaupii]|uniref:Uncharacterized protein n=1 Tax=Synaphobranchus kaupii TaxID=118154 RepID=A0A9Q1JFZ2_SYNKA|nr:hypothetical protein SKAU_G00030070 [Synaphobranchus kaupii]